MNDIITICGGTGFLGRALAKNLREQGNKVRVIARTVYSVPQIEGVEYLAADLNDRSETMNVIAGSRFVYNLAASVGGIHFIRRNRAACMFASRINMNLLEACYTYGVQRYFYASSACVYSSHDFPTQENRSEPANPERGYGWEKLFGEQSCREFRENGLVDTRVARLFTMYGPGDEKRSNHFPSEICKKIAWAKRLGHKSIDVWGDGNQIRSFLYVDDAVEGVQRVMNSGLTKPVNLSSPRGAQIKGIVNLVQDIAGTNFDVHYGSGTTGVQSRYSDNSLIFKELDWEPATKYEDGFRLTWNWWWDKALREITIDSQTS